MDTINRRAWLGLAFTGIAMGLLLFVPAGTVRYWQAWVFLAVFLGPSLWMTLYLMKHDRALLERRLSAGPTAEMERSQQVIMLFASIGFLGLLVVSALDHRFGWSRLPLGLTVAGDVLAAAGLYIVFVVYRANPFAAGTIQVAEDQRVISTGPYAVVRHPMYAGGMLYVLGMPAALASYWALLVAAGMIPVLLWRLLDEERILSAKLPGYTDYRARVRWRLIPGIF